MKTNNAVKEQSLLFAIEIVKLCKKLHEQKEYVISRQLLKSGTSIGANIKEAEFAQSKADWYSKLKIAEKEANETDYWLILLHETGYISDETYNYHDEKIKQLCRLLAAICRGQKTQATNTNERV